MSLKVKRQVRCQDREHGRSSRFLASRAVPVIIFNKRDASASRIVFPWLSSWRTDYLVNHDALKRRRLNDTDKNAELPSLL